jgi:hypothetical protein
MWQRRNSWVEKMNSHVVEVVHSYGKGGTITGGGGTTTCNVMGRNQPCGGEGSHGRKRNTYVVEGEQPCGGGETVKWGLGTQA